jgi:hypothetical protein
MKNKNKEQSLFVSNFEYMPLFKILEFEKMMEEKNVSLVSRKKGFLKRLKFVKGRYDLMGYVNKKKNCEKWMQRRENFIKRNLARVEKTDEKLYDIENMPTRRTLSLYAWGFDPSIKDTRKARIKLKRK